MEVNLDSGSEGDVTTIPTVCGNKSLTIVVQDTVTKVAISNAMVTIKSGVSICILNIKRWNEFLENFYFQIINVAENVQTDEHGQVHVPISANGNYQVKASKGTLELMLTKK